MHGEKTDLDGWERALRVASQSAPRNTDGSDGSSFKSLFGSDGSSFKRQETEASRVALGQELPDASLTSLHLTPGQTERRVFFSYRVAADAELVEKMHDKLSLQGVGVWWDKVCLAPGLQWEHGFADGLFGASVFVPFLSKAALAPFAKLQSGSGCDNVLLEFRLALELMARGELHRVFPIFLGEPEDCGSLGEGYGDFFQGGGMPAAPDVRVKAVEAKVVEHLKRSGRGGLVLAAADCTVKRVLEAICQHQGEFLRGAPKRVAVEMVVSALVRVSAEGVSAQTGHAGLAPQGAYSLTVERSAGGWQVIGDPLPPIRPLASVPPEVPMLPSSAVERTDLMDALKLCVLKQDAGSGANATTVTAPPKKSGNTTATNGMGGVGAHVDTL